MKFKIILGCVALTFVVGLGVLLYNKQNAPLPNLQLITEQGAGIHDFYIQNNKVYIVGGVSIKNNTSEMQKYSLTATSEYDHENGLIKSATLEGYDDSLESNEFTIAGNETQTFTIVFVGDYAGTPQKGNRLMPEISIVSK